MNNYELMVIFTPVLSEEDYKAAQKKYTAFIKDNGGEVVHENPWGLKSLAYPIRKRRPVYTGFWSTVRHPTSMRS
jgi:small subunit ribosomal protein S6